MKTTNTNENILTNFGKAIKNLRNKCNKSQFEMAIGIECDPKSLRKIENGLVNPTYQMVKRIVEYFEKRGENITLEKLLLVQSW